MAVKPLRKPGIFCGLIFQLMIAVTMKHLIYFNLIMASFFVLFIDEDTLRLMKLPLRINRFDAGKK